MNRIIFSLDVAHCTATTGMLQGRNEVAHVPVHHCHSVADALGSGTARVLCWSTMPEYLVWQVRFSLPCIGDSKDVLAY